MCSEYRNNFYHFFNLCWYHAWCEFPFSAHLKYPLPFTFKHICMYVCRWLCAGNHLLLVISIIFRIITDIFKGLVALLAWIVDSPTPSHSPHSHRHRHSPETHPDNPDLMMARNCAECGVNGKWMKMMMATRTTKTTRGEMESSPPNPALVIRHSFIHIYFSNNLWSRSYNIYMRSCVNVICWWWWLGGWGEFLVQSDYQPAVTMGGRQEGVVRLMGGVIKKSESFD